MTSQRQRLLDEAQWAIEHRQFDRAVRVYRQLFEANPQSIQIGLKLGELYLKMEARHEALQIYWQLAIAEHTQQNESHQKTLLHLVLKLDHEHLKAHIRLLELNTSILLKTSEPNVLAQLISELTETLNTIIMRCRFLQHEERLVYLERILSLSLDKHLPADTLALFSSRLQYAQSCEYLGKHEEGLPYYLWLALEADQQDPAGDQVEHYGKLALIFEEKFSPKLRRHLRLSIARALLPKTRVRSELVEQVYLSLEPLIQCDLTDDLEAHFLLANLLRVQGHDLDAIALLHDIGSHASKLNQRALAIVAYESILSEHPKDQLAQAQLERLNSAQALFIEARNAFQNQNFEYAFEYLRALIERGESFRELYELLIQTADALELETLQISSRISLLDWALAHQIDYALQPMFELCQAQTSLVIPYLKQYHWLYLAVRDQLDEVGQKWLLQSIDAFSLEQTLDESNHGQREDTASNPLRIKAHENTHENTHEEDTINADDCTDFQSSSALNRAQADWNTPLPQFNLPFTPAPIVAKTLSSLSRTNQSIHILNDVYDHSSSLEQSLTASEQQGSDTRAAPLIDLPPLMRELPANINITQPTTSSTSSSIDKPSDSEQMRSSKALELYLKPSRDLDELSSPFFNASFSSESIQPLHQPESLEDPLSLFDSGTSFQGALEADHPLVAHMLTELFEDEADLENSLEQQLTLIETPEPIEFMSPHAELKQALKQAQTSSREETDEFLISEMLQTHEDLISRLHEEHLNLQTLKQKTTTLHLGIHTDMPTLLERLTHLKGRSPNQTQRAIVSLIDAQEYELALAQIPSHLKTSSIHYLKAICLYGQGYLEEALELVEMTLSRSQPLAVEYFYALASELSYFLSKEQKNEQYLIELLTVHAELGAIFYQAFRS